MENTGRNNRFKDAPWFPGEDDLPVLIGGAGGIGSWTALLISRAGFKTIIYDDDILEIHNIGGQLYPDGYIGQSKVNVLQTTVKQFSGMLPMIFNEKIEFDSPTNPYVIAAFDNMLARKNMFTSWKEAFGEDNTALFIDGRLTAEQMWIFCIKGGDVAAIKEYEEKHLFDDSEVEDAPCTMKQTSHAAAMIAAHITGFFTNHITNIKEKESLRDVPFCWEYFIPMDMVSSNYVNNEQHSQVIN